MTLALGAEPADVVGPRSLCAPRVAATPPDPHPASSSVITASATRSGPGAPVVLAELRRRTARSRRRSRNDCRTGKSPARSHSSACGASARSTSRRTVARSSSCSSVNRPSAGSPRNETVGQVTERLERAWRERHQPGAMVLEMTSRMTSSVPAADPQQPGVAPGPVDPGSVE